MLYAKLSGLESSSSVRTDLWYANCISPLNPENANTLKQKENLTSQDLESDMVYLRSNLTIVHFNYTSSKVFQF